MSDSAPEQFAVECARIAADHQAQDITVMDLRGMSAVTDYFVICSGTSSRQRQTVCDKVREHARRLGEPIFGTSGYETSNWILVDFVDVVVHVFAPEFREYYDLELLWGDAQRVEWARSATA